MNVFRLIGMRKKPEEPVRKPPTRGSWRGNVPSTSDNDLFEPWAPKSEIDQLTPQG